jgi:2-polyprenyl-3-methyl-5-hydroxy-6-metoxy-1,4-benzoquinol methylase
LTTEYRDYGFSSPQPEHTADYLIPAVISLLPTGASAGRMLDVGCGNGYLAGQMMQRGWSVVGVDLSEQGIQIARKQYPKGRFEVYAADDQILSRLGEQPFDVVVSTEVIEHLYAPRSFVAGCKSALRPGGRLICSTPYHGYLKNLMIAAANGMDKHANPLWDGGHIKLWSRRTLGQILNEAGFVNLQFRGAGRLPLLWKSMVMSGDNPL